MIHGDLLELEKERVDHKQELEKITVKIEELKTKQDSS